MQAHQPIESYEVCLSELISSTNLLIQIFEPSRAYQFADQKMLVD